MKFITADIDGATQAPGSEAPPRGVQILGQDGADSRVLLVDAAGRPLVTVATALPAGTNKIGSVQLRDPSDTVHMGGATNPVRVDPTGSTTQPVSAASLPLPTGAATEATLATRAASAQLPASLVGGRLDANIGAWLGSTVPTVGQKTMVNSVPVTLAANQSPLSVTFTQSGARTGVSGSFLTLGGGTAGVLQTLRATVYNEPTAAAQRSLSSSSASDAAAGTGARTVRITYYNDAGAGPFYETVTLNGTTAVNTVATDIQFIESMDVVTAGSAGANVGTITLHTATGGGGTVIGTIGIGNLIVGVGDNQTFWSHHYVAAGYVAELASLVAGVQSGGSATSARFFLRQSQPLVVNSSETVVGGAVLVEGSFARSYEFNPKVTGFARITAYTIPVVNNATVSLTFDWSEVMA